MKSKRKIIEINEELCNGCGQCVDACAEGAIRLINGKAKLVSEVYCDGLGACIGDCPTGALKIVEREADDFDEEKVKVHLAAQRAPAHVCPGSQMRQFKPASGPRERSSSALSHWPVQIRLVSPMAPFLQGADLLVAADCVPFAYPNFHQDFLAGKVVMVGCPKFDDVDLYIERFEDIFNTASIKSVTAVVMQVPCCQGLPTVVQEAMQRAKKDIPFKKVVVSLEGEILSR